jgi:DNA-binding FrmR family transcriptional regulator
MTKSTMIDEKHAKQRKDVLSRLRRAEGQVKALTRAVEAGADCRSLVTQIKAARTALDAAGKLVLACYLAECADDAPEKQREAIELLVKF